jgi:hypothetical protein
MLKDLKIERQLDEDAAKENYPEISNEQYLDVLCCEGSSIMTIASCLMNV